jgi:ubiquinone biosynthesis protein
MEEEPMLDVLLDWAESAYVEEAQLAADINELAFEYEGVALADIRIGVLIRRFAAIVRDHSIVLPADLTLMFKALVTMEGLGREYDPGFRIVEHLTPMLRASLRERYQPEHHAPRTRRSTISSTWSRKCRAISAVYCARRGVAGRASIWT